MAKMLELTTQLALEVGVHMYLHHSRAKATETLVETIVHMEQILLLEETMSYHTVKSTVTIRVHTEQIQFLAETMSYPTRMARAVTSSRFQGLQVLQGLQVKETANQSLTMALQMEMQVMHQTLLEAQEMESQMITIDLKEEDLKEMETALTLTMTLEFMDQVPQAL
jgi:hypothetical protein